MVFFAFGILLLGYWLGWDGYATLQQPTGANVGGIGIVDLILPSRVAKVDAAIINNWNKTQTSTPGVSGTAGQGVVEGGKAAIKQQQTQSQSKGMKRLG